MQNAARKMTGGRAAGEGAAIFHFSFFIFHS
jgi:hypothetical protein